MKQTAALFFVASAMGLFHAALAQTPQPLFGPTDAEAGRVVYDDRCASCHGYTLEGVVGPALMGPQFRQKASLQKLTAASLRDAIAQSMPQEAPGSLPPADYDAVTAYILRQNGFPSGQTTFAANRERMKTVALGGEVRHGSGPGVTKPGPAARPAGALGKVTDQRLVAADSEQDNWLLHGRTYDSQRHSPLTQINQDNVARLKVVSEFRTGRDNGMQATPIVVDGIMYISTYDAGVQAFEPLTGRRLWEYVPSQDYGEGCCGKPNRGVAVAYGKVFLAQFDGAVVALDAASGKQLWKTDRTKTLPEPRQFYTMTLAPQVYDGMVIVGTAGAEYETRGMLQAYDQASGKLLWTFHTTAAPDQPGGDTWGGKDGWKTGGGSIWATPSVDPKTGLIIFATGNPNPDYRPDLREGDNLYTVSIVAVHAKTGKIAWWYQMVPHDLWDYDASAPVMLFDAKDDQGRIVPAAGQAGKVGWVFIVNRETGKLLRRSEAFVEQSANIFTPPKPEGVSILPGVGGGALWQPPAYSPRTRRYYTLGNNRAMIFTQIPLKSSPADQPGLVGRRTGGVMKTDSSYKPWGSLSAIDVDTGKIAWQKRFDEPVFGGVLSTASDLVFAGEQNGDFHAFDARTGETLWTHNLGYGICTPAITYRIKGVQYLTVPATGCRGGHVPVVGGPPNSDRIVTFAIAP